jgi:hypothetical protein
MILLITGDFSFGEKFGAVHNRVKKIKKHHGRDMVEEKNSYYTMAKRRLEREHVRVRHTGTLDGLSGSWLSDCQDY